MTSIEKVKYEIGTFESSDCDHVLDIFIELDFWVCKHICQLLSAVDNRGVLVAREQQTGLSTNCKINIF